MRALAAAALAIIAAGCGGGHRSSLIAFSRGDPFSFGEQIYVMSEDGGHLRDLSPGTESEALPAWSPDGRRIAFSRVRWRDDPVTGLAPISLELWVMNADGSGRRRLTTRRVQTPSGFAGCDCDAAWSPDGRRIAFASDRDGGNHIYVVGLDGDGLRQLTDGPADDTGPSWSPDGTRIAFARETAEGRSRLVVAGADGGGLRQLAPGEEPAWSPDGRMIAFARGGLIFLAHADGTGERQLTSGPGDGAPAWSPDGKRIAFTAKPGTEERIEVVSTDGTGRKRLTRGSAPDLNPAWQPR